MSEKFIHVNTLAQETTDTTPIISVEIHAVHSYATITMYKGSLQIQAHGYLRRLIKFAFASDVLRTGELDLIELLSLIRPDELTADLLKGYSMLLQYLVSDNQKLRPLAEVS